jgi:hypothetical protein
MNYGTRLYQKGIQRQEEIERKHKQAMIQKEINEMKDLSFHPTINPVSYYFGSKGEEKLEDYLLKKGMLTKDKIEQKRAERLYTTLQSWSFQPKINNYSRKIVDQRDQFFGEEMSIDDQNSQFERDKKFNELYSDAMRRFERHDKIYSIWIDSEWTFQPDIVRTRRNISPKYAQTKQIISDKSMIEKFNNENFDPSTGQAFFRPKINNVKIKQQRSSKSIGNLLYGYKDIYRERKQKMVEEHERQLKSIMNQKHSNKVSDQLVDNIKNKRLDAILHLLQLRNWEEDHLDNSKITPEIMELVAPLFYDFQESEQKENIKDGISRDCSFEPKINKRSKRLALQKANPNEKVEDALIRKKEELESRLNMIRKQKKKEELKGCTFQPNIDKSQTDLSNVFHNATQRQANIINFIHPPEQYQEIRNYIPARSEDSENY